MLAASGLNGAESPIVNEARLFRVHAYQNYRTDRARYNEVRRLEERLAQDWQDAGRPASREGEVVAWYRAALLTPANSSLPTSPDFSRLIAERKAKRENKSTVTTVSETIVSAISEPADETDTLPPDESTPAPSGSISRSLVRAVWNALMK